MKKFLARFKHAIKGILNGFDRIVFKGTILALAHEAGVSSFLWGRGVLNRDYKRWMQQQSSALIEKVEQYSIATSQIIWPQ